MANNTKKPSPQKRANSGNKQASKARKAGNKQSHNGHSAWYIVRYAWQHGNTRQRTTLATVGVIASLLVLVLVISGVKFVQWRAEISQVRGIQQELAQEYDFNPGNIISDAQFFNGQAMNEQQIQAFLDEQGEACTGKSCLHTATFETQNREATEYCKEYKAQGKQKAAHIIATAAQSCSVSPKVLLTMLQKEQQLVTSKNPKTTQYDSAMGLSCPDFAHCDPEYKGFFKQVFGSAERYQYYVNHEDQYDFHANQLNYVQYNPDPACGGSQVYIENKATALLYIYTPYQPNTAALQAGAGEGDACSAYGNRNFSIIYSGWFGDPRRS